MHPETVRPCSGRRTSHKKTVTEDEGSKNRYRFIREPLRRGLRLAAIGSQPFNVGTSQIRQRRLCIGGYTPMGR